MQTSKKWIIAALIVALAAFVHFRMGPQVPESCFAAREAMKQLVTNDSGLASLVATGTEQVLPQAIAAHFSSMDATQCAATQHDLAAGLNVLTHTKWAAQMQEANDDLSGTLKECHDRRVYGEIKTHAESAQCSNPKITEFYQHAGYPYMDLVAQFTAKRLQQAADLDKNNPQGTEEPVEFARLAIDVAEQERRRNMAAGNGAPAAK